MKVIVNKTKLNLNFLMLFVKMFKIHFYFNYLLHQVNTCFSDDEAKKLPQQLQMGVKGCFSLLAYMKKINYVIIIVCNLLFIK